MNPRVQHVVPKDDYKLQLTFTNGEIGVFDYAHLVDFSVFREFKRVSYVGRAWSTEPSRGLMSKKSVRTPFTKIPQRWHQ